MIKAFIGAYLAIGFIYTGMCAYAGMYENDNFLLKIIDMLLSVLYLPIPTTIEIFRGTTKK